MSEKFQKIGIIGKFNDPGIGPTLAALCDILDDHRLTLTLETSAAQALPERGYASADLADLGRNCDLAIILGGDGTLLHAARTLVDSDIPLVGVNLGRLGFLVDISPANMRERLGEILAGHYHEEQRFLLEATVERDGQRVHHGNAFNDVVIHKWNSVRMIEFETRVDGLLVNSQRSDGLIVSTPTGSTAYALSAGGPILDPSLNAIVLVPVCPHTLSNRPLVVSGDSQIDVCIKDGHQQHARVTFDGQTNFALHDGDKVRIARKAKAVTLIHPAGHDQFQILRAKLRWG